MNSFMARRFRGERGAALILAIAFMVVVGGIGAAVTASVTSGLNGRVVLDELRNREYAADGAIETSITRIRGLSNPGGNPAECSSTTPVDSPFTLNGVTVRVDCVNAPAVVGAPNAIVLQKNVIFTACVNTGIKCSDDNHNVIIRASVNFQGTGPPGQVKTYVQAWSVNG
jgi:hypothetical protein